MGQTKHAAPHTLSWLLFQFISNRVPDFVFLTSNSGDSQQGSWQSPALVIFSSSLVYTYAYIFNNIPFLSYFILLLYIGVVVVRWQYCLWVTYYWDKIITQLEEEWTPHGDCGLASGWGIIVLCQYNVNV